MFLPLTCSPPPKSSIGSDLSFFDLFKVKVSWSQGAASFVETNHSSSNWFDSVSRFKVAHRESFCWMYYEHCHSKCHQCYFVAVWICCVSSVLISNMGVCVCACVYLWVCMGASLVTCLNLWPYWLMFCFSVYSLLFYFEPKMDDFFIFMLKQNHKSPLNQRPPPPPPSPPPPPLPHSPPLPCFLNCYCRLFFSYCHDWQAAP